MRFLWFGKKKPPALVASTELEAIQVESFSVIGFVSEPNPLVGGKASQLEAETIHSCILSLLKGANSPADLAAQEFFQERGAIVLPIVDYSFTPDRGSSARVVDGDRTRTVLMGAAEVIARASAPFSPAIAGAVAQNPQCFVAAIDGVAYASFAVVSELS